MLLSDILSFVRQVVLESFQLCFLSESDFDIISWGFHFVKYFFHFLPTAVPVHTVPEQEHVPEQEWILPILHLLYAGYRQNPTTLEHSQADIRSPLRYLLITECCFAAYQEWLTPLLIQANPTACCFAQLKQGLA